MNEEKTQPKAVPLIERLRSVPKDTRLMIADGQFSSRSIPVGAWFHEAADALSASPSVNEEKTEAAGGVGSSQPERFTDQAKPRQCWAVEMGWERKACETPCAMKKCNPAGVPASPAPSDDAAKAIYATWRHQQGWVPWVEGGNSLMQDKARRMAAAGVLVMGQHTNGDHTPMDSGTPSTPLDGEKR